MNLPRRLFKFNYLRHLNLELVIVGEEEREIDVLDYAQVLEVAPFIQKLELRVSLSYILVQISMHENKFRCVKCRHRYRIVTTVSLSADC